MAILPVFIPHAGCPHQCVFCNQKAISGQKSAALEHAARQIAIWRSRLRPSPANEAAFYGGSFTGLPASLQEQLLQLTDKLLEEGVIGGVRLSTRPDYIDEEKLALLKRHHVSMVELGVQSLDDAVLQAAARGHTAEDVYKAVSLLRSSGFGVGLQLMAGMPGQSFASLKETAEKAAALKPDIARIYPLLVIEGTPLAESWRAGKFAPLSLEDAVKQAAYACDVLEQAGVRVIRIGLQPDEELCAPGNILAGPFHPSMGELVRSRILRRRLTPVLQQMRGSELTLLCSRRLESKLRGQKNCNGDYWRRLLPGRTVKISAAGADGRAITVRSELGEEVNVPL